YAVCPLRRRRLSILSASASMCSRAMAIWLVTSNTAELTRQCTMAAPAMLEPSLLGPALLDPSVFLGARCGHKSPSVLLGARRGQKSPSVFLGARCAQKSENKDRPDPWGGVRIGRPAIHLAVVGCVILYQLLSYVASSKLER